jgi:hypothetical protein
MRILFLERDDLLFCKTENINLPSLVASISRYKYFYKKEFVFNNKKYFFNGISLNYYEKHKDKIKVYNINLYKYTALSAIHTNLIVEKEKKEERFSSDSLLELFKREYKEVYNGTELLVDNKFEYINKFRKLMDAFYESNLGDNSIVNYIKQCCKFGNYKGDGIYINFIFDKNTIQNYILYCKGFKDITNIWRYLSVETSALERKKIKYIMNLKNFDYLENIEKDICLKLYKIYDYEIYKDLKKKHVTKANNAKSALFAMIMKEYNMSIDECLKQMKHKQIYLEYDFTKSQIKGLVDN